MCRGVIISINFIILDLVEFPPCGKKANVTPVFKSAAKEMVENYRSISLLSIPSKCQEKIVHNTINSHVAPYLSDWQHGFVGVVHV